MINALERYDPQIYELMRQESARQSGSIRLIPYIHSYAKERCYDVLPI